MLFVRLVGLVKENNMNQSADIVPGTVLNL